MIGTFRPRLASTVVALGLLATAAAGARADYTNDLLVTSLTGGKFSAFNPTTGAPTGSFSGDPSLPSPRGIVVGPDDNIYVNDSVTGAIQKYSGSTGALIGTFVSPADNHGLSGAYGMTFGPDGNLYVSSFGTNSVLVFSGATGAFVKSITGGALSGPTSLAFSPVDGNLYVASSLNSVVLRFDPTAGPNGTPVGQFGPPINNVSGLAFGNNLLYVAAGAPGSNAFAWLDIRSGNVLGSTNDTAHLFQPGGIVVGPDGKVDIASYGNNTVVQYNADGSFNKVLVGPSAGLSGPVGLALGVVPEPSSAVLTGLGLLGLGGLLWRRGAAGRR